MLYPVGHRLSGVEALAAGSPAALEQSQLDGGLNSVHLNYTGIRGIWFIGNAADELPGRRSALEAGRRAGCAGMTQV